MTTILDEKKAGGNPGVPETPCACGAAHLGGEVKETARRFEKGVDRAKVALSEKIEDGKTAANRLLKCGQYAVEDGMEETMHQIKRNPVGSLAIAFAAGAAFGFLALFLPRLGKK